MNNLPMPIDDEAAIMRRLEHDCGTGRRIDSRYHDRVGQIGHRRLSEEPDELGFERLSRMLCYDQPEESPQGRASENLPTPFNEELRQLPGWPLECETEREDSSHGGPADQVKMPGDRAAKLALDHFDDARGMNAANSAAR